jgi:hypothetical protein
MHNEFAAQPTKAFTTRLDTKGEYVLPPAIVPFPRGFASGRGGTLLLASGIGPNGEGDNTILTFGSDVRIRPCWRVKDAELSSLDLTIASSGNIVVSSEHPLLRLSGNTIALAMNSFAFSLTITLSNGGAVAKPHESTAAVDVRRATLVRVDWSALPHLEHAYRLDGALAGRFRVLGLAALPAAMRITSRERRKLREAFSDFASAGEQLVGRHNLIARAPLLNVSAISPCLRRYGADLLSSLSDSKMQSEKRCP